MAALSVLRCFYNGLKPGAVVPNSARHMLICRDLVRGMSTQNNKFSIQPSRFQWNKFKDYMHYYLMITAIPLGCFIFGVNVYIGPAELAEIPEGYEPKDYEYYRHPIKRWFSRYIYKSEQEHYEKYLHFICAHEEQRQMKLIQKKVYALMAQRGDYKGWYYMPITGKYHRIVREDEKRTIDDYTGQY